MQATRGAVVSMNYEVRNDQGELLDATDTPIEYLHGYGNIIPGLEKGLEGAEPGEHRSVVVEPAEAYGEFDPDAVVTLPYDAVLEGVQLEPGMRVVGDTPSGPIELIVREVNEDTIVVDANHPLAGQRLYFEVDVVDVRAASEQELAQGYVA
ncbi:MAG: peptidylprolyl isomerase [Thermoleophilia bacterium]|nr:peptidylprolyl isomerase [Thermoleophilia bacterium]